MGMRELENEILAELKTVAENTKLRKRDIMEWSTSELEAQDGETRYYLPTMKIWCCVKT